MLDNSRTGVPDSPAKHAKSREWRPAAPEPGDALRQRLMRGLVVGLDAVLRACYGISEFTDDPECLIRVARGQAHCALRLLDGTDIRAGDPILVLHFWNEHLLRFERGRPSLGWASVMRRRVSQSLEALAVQVASDPLWQDVRAVRADTALFGFWRMYQARRVIRRFGFEVVPPENSRLRALRGFTDNCVVWMLTRAFNPAALRRQEFVRGRDEMWMSRGSLIRQYRRGPLGDGLATGEARRAPASPNLRKPHHSSGSAS